ncbi:hypothetical protein SCYAM73S_00163 [Streptomyces cyaneofuscatus]
MPDYTHYATGEPVVDTKAPEGPVAERWDTRRFQAKLVNPANRRKHTVIVVGTGLAGGSAGATLAEQGYHVVQFCFQDSPRRAHSVAAQGGINAAKNYRNDGDSIHRLFYDTVKGGDFRARESNVHRLAQISVEIIDQCVAQGVPFAREYGGLLDNRSFGGVQVSRTFYARGQTGQQLLLGAYQALSRQIATGGVELHARTEMLDLIVVDGKARGIVARDLVTGKIDTYFADAVDRIIQSGGYISAPTGTAPDAHATPVPKPDAELAFENAECIGCGACVAACPNGSAMLFTAAKVNHLNVLPQGAPERETRVLDMVAQMDEEGFGGCTLTGECATACPKGIPLPSIAAMNKEWLRATRKVRR